MKKSLYKILLHKLYDDSYNHLLNNHFFLKQFGGLFVEQPNINKVIEKVEWSTERLHQEVVKFLLYKWCIDNTDNRYKDIYQSVVIPKDINGDLKNVPFNEILMFISPQTKITWTT